jgi:DNA polymerase elongation subunit (family B)
MINIPLEKLLFIDIETVGIQPDWESLEKSNLELSFVFENYFDWFQKRFPEDADKPVGQMFVNRAALVPEFARIACVSVAFVTDKGETKVQSFSNKNEKDLLQDVQKLLRRVGELGFFLCGHNVKGFDIPMLAKRMIINGLLPPKILPGHDTKPWEIKALDTKELWQYGGYGTIASLELMCVSMGVES